jgi:hypothetical protein
MNRIIMRFILVFLVLCMSTTQLFSQRTAFLYLQSEDGMPFYVKYEKKIYSSTVSGFLILGKLPESELLFNVGFPGNLIPEIEFRLPPISNGKGVLMKSFGEKGWGLFDFQDASVIYALIAETTTVPKITPQNQPAANDPFATMLSDVTRDSTVKYVGVKPTEAATGEELKKDSITKATSDTTTIIPITNTGLLTASTTDSSKIDQSVVFDKTVVSTSTPQKKIFPRSEIAVHSNEIVSEGTKLLFLISEQGLATDTVKAFLPVAVQSIDSGAVAASKGVEPEIRNEITGDVSDSTSKTVSIPLTQTVITADSTANVPASHNQTPSSADTLVRISTVVDSSLNLTTQQEPKSITTIQDQKTEKGTLTVQFEKPALTDSAYVENKVENAPVEIKENQKNPSSSQVQGSQPVFSTNCKKAATDEDFLKVRRKMAQQTKDEEMVNEAQKFFKHMCFTTEQIRNLGALFLSEEGRYRFYDAALKSVLDPQHFSSLENTLITPYYKKRFQALIPE